MAKRLCFLFLMFLIIAGTVSTVLGSATPPYSIDFDLHNMAGFDDNTISAGDIEAYIQEKYPNSPLLSEPNIGRCFIKAAQENNVNPAFLVATAELEGRFGTAGWANSHPECHNTFGYSVPSGSTQPDDYNCVDSWCAMMQRVASVIAHGNNYYAQGRYTVRQVREKFAAESNEASIVSFMNELYLFSANRKSSNSPEPRTSQLSMPNPSTTQKEREVRIPLEQWNKTFDKGVLYSVQNSDNGYIAAGYKYMDHTSEPAVNCINTYHCDDDAFLIKVDNNGNKIWSKNFGGAESDVAYELQPASDGGYFLEGNTQSFDVSGNYYGAAWLIKTDSAGNELWNRSFIGTEANRFYYVQPTSDGGCIIAAGGHNIEDYRNYGSGSASTNDRDAWLIKFDSAGNIIWKTAFDSFGQKGDDFPVSNVILANDGGYIFPGRTGFSGFYLDWIIKTDSEGNEIWNKTLAKTEFIGENEEHFNINYGSIFDPNTGWVQIGNNFRFKRDGSGSISSLSPTADGGYIVAGWKQGSNGYDDAMLTKIDSQGNEIWSKTYGGDFFDNADLVQSTQDGGYLLGGVTRYTGDGNFETWLIKVDSEGNKLWNKTFGGRGSHRGDLILLTQDGSCILKGRTDYSGEPYYRFDTWLIKINPTGEVAWNRTFRAYGNIRAYSALSTAYGGCVVAGVNSGNVWLTKIGADGTVEGDGEVEQPAEALKKIDDKAITSSKTQQKSPGFDGAIAIAGLICTYILRRRK